MVHLRQEKIDRIARRVPDLEVFGPSAGDLLVLGWGSTSGAIRHAVENVQQRGYAVAGATLRYLNPMPRNLEAVLRSYRRVLLPELNLGQLKLLLRARFLIDIEGLNKVRGQPFRTSEIEEKILAMLGAGVNVALSA
jgi:2-oxoglutarate ferredoxin oxidoreductase subunit alpha